MTSSERARRERLHGPQPAEGPAPKVGADSKPSNPYARFIPREELGTFASWKPGALAGGSAPPIERRAANGDRRARPDSPASKTPPPPPPPEVVVLQQQHAAALKTVRQAGYQDGYRDGLVALESFKQTFAQQITTQVAQLFEATGQQLHALQGRMAEAVTETAVRLARQVLHQELHGHPDAISQVASEAIESLVANAQQLTLRVHADDLATLQQGASDLLQRRGVQLVADPSISRGGCLLSSDAAIVDAQIETRWAAAAARFGLGSLPWQGELLTQPSSLGDAVDDTLGDSLARAQSHARGHAPGQDKDPT